ncbi:hypothetical protein KAJ27_16335 [bacterium]|nr:hypothetical protein [bacterium]
MKKVLIFVFLALLVITIVEARSSGYGMIPFPRSGNDLSFSFHRGKLVTRHAGDVLIEKIRLPGRISDLFQNNAGWVLGTARAGQIGMYKDEKPRDMSIVSGKKFKETHGIIWFGKQKSGNTFSNHPTGFLVKNRSHFANINFFFRNRRGDIYEVKVLKVLGDGLKIHYKRIRRH